MRSLMQSPALMAFILLVLTGCVETVPGKGYTSGEYRSLYYVNSESALKDQNREPDGDVWYDWVYFRKYSKERAKNLRTDLPMQLALIETFRKHTAGYDQAFQFVTASQGVANLKQDGVLTPENQKSLEATVAQAAKASNWNSRVRWDLDDEFRSVLGMNTAEMERIIFVRSIDKLKDGVAINRLLPKTIAYVTEKGEKSAEYKLLQDALPSIQFSDAELRYFVSEAYPDYARTELEKRPTPTEAKCLGFGFKRGTDGFANCLMFQEDRQARDLRQALEDDARKAAAREWRRHAMPW
ncbi:hypothetical protein [Azospirillum argentinense]